MNKELLNDTELDVLKNKIEEAEIYRNSQLKQQSIIVFVSCSLAGIILYVSTDFQVLPLVLAMVGFCIFFLSVLTFAWWISGKSIRKLKEDLNSNIKLLGLSKITHINKLNRKIILEDKTYLWEPSDFDGTWNKGDLIRYSRTISNECIFERIKTTPQHSV